MHMAGGGMHRGGGGCTGGGEGGCTCILCIPPGYRFRLGTVIIWCIENLLYFLFIKILSSKN
jgi:hypothetical protein